MHITNATTRAEPRLIIADLNSESALEESGGTASDANPS
jgi:hypothetical protein